MDANTTPHNRAAGQTENVWRHRVIERISQNGRISAVHGRIRPTIALRSASGSPVTATNARIGFPTPPNATGAVLAIRHSTAAPNGLKPSPTIIAPPTATGAPPPPDPSSTAPKAKAISNTCRRLSGVSPPIDSLM